MAKKDEQKALSRQKILVAAAECFAEKGYEGCAIADIADRAGMSKGNIYVHFTSKEELFKCMIQEDHMGAARKLKQALVESGAVEALLELLFRCIREVSYPVDHRLWLECLSVAGRNEAIRESFIASDRIMRDAFISLLKKAAENGEVDDSLDFETISLWIYALADGLIARTAHDKNFRLEDHIESLEKLLRRALGAEKKPD
ncbi:TetR family transcriptional regulator [Deltaproteobacteria bacterium Smac51]|nr:TetR family transcriptional regulator [Deltaproteobacteria bacterium Smac51]